MTIVDPSNNVSPPEQRRRLLAQLLRDKARQSHVICAASTAQCGLWFMQQLDAATYAYHLPFCVRISSPINPAGVKSALQQLVDRHAMLRTTFRNVGSQVEMLIHGAGQAEFAEIDAADWSDEELRQRVERSFRQPFDLQNGPLMRLHLFTRDETNHVLLLVLHHLICDGWALAIVVREFMECYQAEVEGRTAQLPPLEIEYAAYVHEHQQRMAGPVGEDSKTYWLNRLSGEIPRLDLPTSHSRQDSIPASSAVDSFEIDEPLYGQLNSVAQSCGATLFSVVIAAYQTLLMRLSGQQDILLGVPMAGRNHPGYEGIVGHFVNLVVIRGQMTDKLTFRELVSQSFRELQGAVEHQDYPFIELIKHLRPVGRSDRTPLFRTVLNLIKIPPGHPMAGVLSHNQQRVQWGPLTIASFPVEELEEHHDLGIRLVEIGPRLQAKLQYDNKLFDAELIEHFVACLLELLKSATAEPDRPLAQLALLPAAEREKLLVSWNATAADYPREASVHQLFAQQAARTPDSTALVFADTQLSYRELDQRANQLARYLRQQGIGRDDLVAVCTERSPELAIALLGTLKAGAAYVPVDPNYPADRVEFMLKDSQARLVLTTAACDPLVESVTAAPRFCLNRDWRQLEALANDELPSITAPLDLAYVIYTSGSTGQPKGVQIPHRALVNFIWSMRERPGLSADDVLLSVTTFSFDIFGLELFLPLVVGARLELASAEEVVDGNLLARRLARCGATVMQATPVSWRMLLAAGFQTANRFKALCGGEALPVDLAEVLLAAGIELWNMYGPTETTIWSCVELVQNATARISIGRPIANTQVYVLDAQLQPVPVGAVGQLYLGGDGLARGYLRRPELTAEKFIDNPLATSDGQQIYDTGDLARFLTDGRLECLGRTDHQIKIRGYRIELEEIETILAKHPGVAQVVVVLRETRPGNQLLAAYYVPAADAPAAPSNDLRALLEKQLPEYMIPAAFIPMDALPLTPNGKVDRKALPAPQSGDHSPGSDQGADSLPPNENEQFLIEIWKEMLGLSEVSPTDNFFEIGGHSLLATQMFARLEGLYRRPLPVALLFPAPTIRELSQEIELFPPVSAGPHVFTFRAEGTQPPLFFMPSMAGTVLQWREFVRLFPSNRPICGIYMAGEPDYARETSFEELATECAKAIALAYPGVPCHLCGYSFGGILAFEVARQLTAMGREVGILAILDSAPAAPIGNSLGDVLRHSPQILKNLLARAVAATSGQQWREELRALISKFGLVRRRLTAGRANSAHREDIAFEYMFGKIEIPDKTRRLLSWSLKLQAAYRPRHYSGNLLLLRAAKRPLFGPFEKDLGWGDYVDGDVTVTDFPGGHGQIVEDRQLIKIADLLTESFERYSSNGSDGPA